VKLTKDQLKELLDVIASEMPAVGVISGTHIDQSEVDAVNTELRARGIQSPVVIVDVDDPYSTAPGLAQRLDSIGNSVSGVSGEISLVRSELHNHFSALTDVLRDIEGAIRVVDSSDALPGIQRAIEALLAVEILAQPLPPEDERIGEAADRVVEALGRRPELREAVASKLGGRK